MEFPSRFVFADGNPFLRPSANQGRCGVRHCGGRTRHPRPKAQKNNEFFAAG